MLHSVLAEAQRALGDTRNSISLLWECVLDIAGADFASDAVSSVRHTLSELPEPDH